MSTPFSKLHAIKRMGAYCSFFLLTATANAQQPVYFKNALAANVPSRYGREAIYTDALAYQLYTSQLKAPQQGAIWGKADNGADISWQPVTADSNNRLFYRSTDRRNPFGRSGYMYLTYNAEKEGVALLNIKGNSSLFFNGEPHTGDPYSSGWMYIPVKLKKGLNELYVRGIMVTAYLSFPAKPVLFNTGDATLPHIRLGGNNTALQGAVVVINTSERALKGLRIRSVVAGRAAVTELPEIPARTTRKVAFNFDGSAATSAGKVACALTLLQGTKSIDDAKLQIETAAPTDKYSVTFTSQIDGSLQYYAVAPQSGTTGKGSALFFSVHGAGVEAIGQARAYKSKDWGNLVAPTNRRPRGFNWEDWGRLDALEVLQLAKTQFKPDPQQVYLTGHSMGGHGTWFLGATYPDKWAAIAPCAGYPTLKGYGSADGLIPDSSSIPLEQVLLRSGNQSDVIKLAQNYKPLGVYIFHGDSDRTVSVDYARQMREVLGDFHTDLSYYEYPGGSHWFGDHSVDWQPIFDFFKWHQRKLDTAVNIIDFTTASPGISASYYWASVLQQQQPLQYSRLQLNRNRNNNTIIGTTENVRLLQFDLKDFGAGAAVNIALDGSNAITYNTRSAADSIWLVRDGGSWMLGAKPGPEQKGPHRYGTFKDAFNNRMVFVYGTSGTKKENEWAYNKARYDAETWYYRGNGAVDIVADKDFALARYKDRGVILFGNKTTNRAWNQLLHDSPIQMERNSIKAGGKTWQGDDLGAYFVWPIKASNIASVAVIGGTGVKGMNAANANQYFAGASGFPDFMIFSLDMVQQGAAGLKSAGFFDHNWKLDESNMVLGK
ncbi:carboxylesterase family protein [Pseudocnuella soli]|uniref:carboxylesterase family protein n=1 Tax=Pseudocnuella soli TaxID=2502779 RepID=UPI00195BE382|nr:alpha/beta hydrolase-fold protein [Pseudocnuella soli]